MIADNMKLKYIIFCLMAFTIFAGCVERKMVIRSEPREALVFVDGEKVGQTPCDLPFTFYGTRKIVLEKEGYKAMTRDAHLNPPLYQIFPFDFIAEVILPFKIMDTHEFDFTLEKQNIDTDTEDILKRAKELKDKAQDLEKNK